jgi:hypothetical protein
MTPNPVWQRLARLGTIVGILMFLADLAILGRFARLIGLVATKGAGIGPTLGG